MRLGFLDLGLFLWHFLALFTKKVTSGQREKINVSKLGVLRLGITLGGVVWNLIYCASNMLPRPVCDVLLAGPALPPPSELREGGLYVATYP